MIIDCISDLHGHYPELEGGDLLIVAGDLTANDETEQYERFFTWLCMQDHYKKKILISGNHDNALLNTPPKKIENGIYHCFECCEYLCDSGTEFDGLKIWGSPWTKTFDGMNPNCKAFTVDTEQELDNLYYRIPIDIDILITHDAPFGILDRIDFSEGDSSAYSVGSRSLLYHSRMRQPKLHVFGHIHEGYGIFHEGEIQDKVETSGTIFVNASHVNEHYQPVNKPIKVIL